MEYITREVGRVSHIDENESETKIEKLMNAIETGEDFGRVEFILANTKQGMDFTLEMSTKTGPIILQVVDLIRAAAVDYD